MGEPAAPSATGELGLCPNNTFSLRPLSSQGGRLGALGLGEVAFPNRGHKHMGQGHFFYTLHSGLLRNKPLGQLIIVTRLLPAC